MCANQLIVILWTYMVVFYNIIFIYRASVSVSIELKKYLNKCRACVQLYTIHIYGR